MWIGKVVRIKCSASSSNTIQLRSRRSPSCWPKSHVVASAWPPDRDAEQCPRWRRKKERGVAAFGRDWFCEFPEMSISVQVVAMCFSLNPAPNMYPRIKDTLISLFLFWFKTMHEKNIYCEVPRQQEKRRRKKEIPSLNAYRVHGVISLIWSGFRIQPPF
jgi:hypothetical protein